MQDFIAITGVSITKEFLHKSDFLVQISFYFIYFWADVGFIHSHVASMCK